MSRSHHPLRPLPKQKYLASDEPLVSLDHTFHPVVFSSQGIGKTYPTLLAAFLDNGLFAAMVFTLPGIFAWGINAVRWIKLTTGTLEIVFCALWLRWELRRGGLKLFSN